MRPFPVVTRTLVTLGLIAGAAAAGTLEAASTPAWVQGGGVDAQAYPPARYLTGYGLSSPGGSEAEQRQQALAMAREALVSSIRVQVSSEFTGRVTQQNQQMTRFAQNLVRTKADLELDGLDPFLTWQDPRKQVVHALAVLDKARTLNLLEHKASAAAVECSRAFTAARASGDPSAWLQVSRLRAGIDETLLVISVLADGDTPPLACPSAADIHQELRAGYARKPGLDGTVALAALDLGDGLPRGTRVLMDRITFADTPFCGTFSAYLEQALAGSLAALGQVKLLDKSGARAAILNQGMDADLADALRSQAVVRGQVYDLGDEVKLNLRVTSAAGEELAATSQTFPAAVLRKAGLRLVPDNFQEARQALLIDQAKVQASTLKVKAVLDRGDGGIYRQGDRLFLFLRTNLDCYAKVIYQQVDGTKVLIFPNKYHPDGRVKQGQLYQIPPDDHSFELVVEPPFGVEMVKVLASTEPIDVQAQEPDANGLSVVQEDMSALLYHTRGIALRKAQAQYAEDTAVVNTMPADAGPAAAK